MFDETLLDSSPKRDPVLRGIHWLISLGVGVVAFVATYLFFQSVTGGAAKTLALEGIIVGALLFFWALMICYVYADTQHLGLATWAWIVLAVLLPIVGYMIYLVYSAAKTDNWKRATIPIAYIFEVLVAGVLVLIPLIKTEALPMAQLATMLVAPPPPPPPPPPAVAPPKVIIHRVTMAELMKAPTVIPKKIEIVKDQPRPQGAVGVVGGVPGGVPGGQMGGVLGSMVGGMMGTPPPPPKATTPKRIRVGGDVEAAQALYDPSPPYPPLAEAARIQGTVRLEAVISTDGTIQNLKVLSGNPLLVPTALQTVRTWRYRPTLLNGQPVEVVTEIDVNFTLGD